MSESTSKADTCTLCPQDAAVLDAFLANRAAGLASGPMPPDSAERMAKLMELMSVLDACPVEEPATDILKNTLARVDAERNRRQFAEQVAMLAEPRRTLGVHWGQIASAAAVFLIGASLLMPVLERNRDDAYRAVGASNLQMAGKGFEKYAAEHRGVMPKYHTAPNSSWWNVGDVNGKYAQSNSAHLYKLIRQQYLQPEQLADPANPHARPEDMSAKDYDWKAPEQVSYSYQNQHGRPEIRLNDQPYLVILANKNPMFVPYNGKVVHDRSVSPLSASRMYDGRGQNMLTADGHVTWSASPQVVNPRTGQTDNIYAAQGVEDYTGKETPAAPDDAFLVP